MSIAFFRTTEIVEFFRKRLNIEVQEWPIFQEVRRLRGREGANPRGAYPRLDWTSIPCNMGLSENSVPLHPMVLLIIIPTKWLFHWGYTPFSDIPIYVLRFISAGARYSSVQSTVLF